MKVCNSLSAAVILILVGCSGGKGSGKLEPFQPGPASGSGGSDATTLAGPKGGTAPFVKKDPPKEPVALLLSLAAGRREEYVLTNEIHLETTVEGKVFRDVSFLNAQQAVNVVKQNESATTVSIVTSGVKAGVQGEGEVQEVANAWMKRVAGDIEGSVLQGDFDATGRGHDLALYGDGVGLNPMGPQSGSQEVMVGFMGVLLPKGDVKVGDSWKGTFDFTQSGEDLFATQGGRVENGAIPITYTLLNYNKSDNSVQLGIECKGSPTVKVSVDGGLARIKLDVSAKGQALVRLNDGWLQELRVETTVKTDGGGLLYPMKQTIRTVTKRVKPAQNKAAAS